MGASQEGRDLIGDKQARVLVAIVLRVADVAAFYFSLSGNYVKVDDQWSSHCSHGFCCVFALNLEEQVAKAL